MNTSIFLVFYSIRRNAFFMWPGNQFIFYDSLLASGDNFITYSLLCYLYLNSIQKLSILIIINTKKNIH